jgi:hypothetical protein
VQAKLYFAPPPGFLQKLPQRLTLLNLAGNFLSGSIPADWEIPESLSRGLIIYDNFLSGAHGMDGCPQGAFAGSPCACCPSLHAPAHMVTCGPLG